MSEAMRKGKFGEGVLNRYGERPYERWRIMARQAFQDAFGADNDDVERAFRKINVLLKDCWDEGFAYGWTAADGKAQLRYNPDWSETRPAGSAILPRDVRWKLRYDPGTGYYRLLYWDRGRWIETDHYSGSRVWATTAVLTAIILSQRYEPADCKSLGAITQDDQDEIRQVIKDAGRNWKAEFHHNGVVIKTDVIMEGAQTLDPPRYTTLFIGWQDSGNDDPEDPGDWLVSTNMGKVWPYDLFCHYTPADALRDAINIDGPAGYEHPHLVDYREKPGKPNASEENTYD